MKKLQATGILFLVTLIGILSIAISAQGVTNRQLTSGVDITDIPMLDYRFIVEKRFQVFFTKHNETKQVYFNAKPLVSIEFSPSHDRIAFFYKSGDETSDDISLVIFNIKEEKTKEIYHTSHASWDIKSTLHWLGDNYIFFLRYCGTSCQGISLLSLKTGHISNAVLSYQSLPNLPEKTYFKDWFGQKFEIDGLVERVKSETKKNRHYIVFMLNDYKGDIIGKYKFLFNGKALIGV